MRAQAAQVNVQQDTRRIAFAGRGRFSADSLARRDYTGWLGMHAALAFDVVVDQAPAGPVRVHVDCGQDCGGAVDVTEALRALPLHEKATLRIPLQCFVDQGADFAAVDAPFALDSEGPFVASFANIRWQAGRGPGCGRAAVRFEGGQPADLKAITAWLRSVRSRLSSRSPSTMPPAVARRHRSAQQARPSASSAAA